MGGESSGNAALPKAGPSLPLVISRPPPNAPTHTPYPPDLVKVTSTWQNSPIQSEPQRTHLLTPEGWRQDRNPEPSTSISLWTQGAKAAVYASSHRGEDAGAVI